MNFRWFVVLGVVVHLIEGKVKVTTASLTERTSARPTTLMRRIEVRKADYNTQKTTDTFGKTQNIARRQFQSELHNALWKWDLWCMLQPVTGNCGANQTKYYYNAQLDQCLPHLFSGCKRDKQRDIMNQFDTAAECENYCKGSALMPVNMPSGTRIEICSLQPISGRCLGHNLMYYYDVNSDTCKTFVYGGCAGNDNKFDRELQCLYRCGNLQPDKEEEKARWKKDNIRPED